jgi:thioredoxin-like negative regulator of GroEL
MRGGVMKKRATCLITLFIFLFTASVLTASQKREIDWQTNFNEAIELAKEQGKPVMIDFWAIWCPPCRKMDMEVWPDAEVIALSRKFVCIKVDIDRNKSLASNYGIRAIPTLIFTDPLGKKTKKRVGYVLAKKLVPLMLRLLMKANPSDFSSVNKWKAILKKDGKNFEGLFGVAEFYRQLGVVNLSNRYYKRALKAEEAKQNPGLKEDLMLKIGLNYLNIKKYKNAGKTFEKCLKEVQNGKWPDKTLLGLIMAQLGQDKIADAEKTFARLQSQYPDSKATQQAAKTIQIVKNSRH